MNAKSRPFSARSGSCIAPPRAAASSATDSTRTAQADRWIELALELREAVNALKFSPPVSHIYNPLDYAWRAHEMYLRRYAAGPKRIIFVGMNPGPFGMAQTGVPFGEVAAVRGWLRIETSIGKPTNEHPRRAISGFDCTRSEVSGRRLWGLFAETFGVPENFFRAHVVVNYCPLAFMENSGRNRTPDKLPGPEKDALFAACNTHLRGIVELVEPEWIVGVGEFAARRAEEVVGANGGIRIGKILHPSPACPAANRNWSGTVASQLRALGIWR